MYTSCKTSLTTIGFNAPFSFATKKNDAPILQVNEEEATMVIERLHSVTCQF